MTYDQYGDDSVLSLSDRPRPKVGPDEVLVRVHAASVNPVDWKVMSGGLDALMDVRFPAIPGWDVAGVVEELGIDVPEAQVGDEVIAYARKDYVHGGTFAEYVAVPVRALAPKPATVSWAEAAGLPLTGLTALQSLERLNVGVGDTVLLHGASGGVGSMGVQIARALGAERVIGTASTAQHERLRALGADPVEHDDVEAIRALAPQGVDVVLDFAGGTIETTRAVAADGARLASIADPQIQELGGTWLWVRPDAAGLSRLSRMVDEGVLRVEVEAEYALEDLAEAFGRSREGHVHGKLVVRVAG